jgi:uncharacterized protein YneF (UPF0154 family)
MKNVSLTLGALVVLMVWSFGGCASTARYSHDEIKDYPPIIQDYIQKGMVAIGMTPPQVRYAWGAPSTINMLPPTEDGKKKEEWLYSSGVFMKKRLLFIQDKVVDIFPAPQQVNEVVKDEQQASESKKDEQK